MGQNVEPEAELWVKTNEVVSKGPKEGVENFPTSGMEKQKS